MPQLSILFGLLLNVVGLVGFFSTGSIHYTALIPCALGLLLFISGLVALKKNLHHHAMHVAVLVSLIGFLATASSLTKINALINGTLGIHEAATLSKFSTALFCGIFFVLCVRSFVRARLMRRSGATKKGVKGGK
ncbi:MAG: hypothetical protein ACH346_04735 [Chthoniobacterales bacterium]